MVSEKIDKWVQKSPESWSKIAKNPKQKESFDSFKRKLRAGARDQGKFNAIKHMTNEQINTIYQASGLATTTKTKINYKEPAFKPKIIIIKRKGKLYKKTNNQKWEKHTELGIKIAARTKPRSKEYRQQVENIVKVTGRTRQAVVKKIQRTRQKNKK
jgi:hypothetical protein